MGFYQPLRAFSAFIFLLLLFSGTAFSQPQSDAQKHLLISLTGHLSKEQIEKKTAELQQGKALHPPLIVIEVNSSSGDLQSVLELSKKLYQFREESGSKILVYIDNTAIGPAAIIPFLADQLMASYSAIWGDIPQGSQAAIPVNVLRSQVKGMISPANPNGKLLNLLAEGMVDPSIEIVDDQGWKIASSTENAGKRVISHKGETLVVDQNQLKELGLVEKFTSSEQFQELYGTALPAAAAAPLPDHSEPGLLGMPSTELTEKLRKFIKYKTDAQNQIGYIAVANKSTIDQSTWIYIKMALDEYKVSKPPFIILELDTPGGEVFAAEQISDALKDMDVTYGIPIVAFINNWAISAGAMLAYSCRFITISKDASMGAAEPVIASQSGEMQSASEKVNSALRTDFGNRARFFDRNPLIAEAMVDKDIILVLRHGVITKLDNEKQIITSGLNPDKIISPKGKLLTLNAQELIEYGVADLMLLPTKLTPITEEEKLVGKWPASKMLLFQYPFFSAIPNATITSHQMDWKARFFAWLAKPMISSILFLGLMIGAYVEFNSPGFGLPGLVAAVCLFLIILSSFSVQAINWLEIIILLIGVVLILLEIFVLPGFGIPGVLGILFTVAGLFLMMLPRLDNVSFSVDPEKMTIAGQYFLSRLGWLCGTLLFGFLCMYLLGKFVMPKFSRFNKLVLTGEQDSSRGYVAGLSLKNLPDVGSKGEALSSLRPSGKVLIQDTVYDAMSEGGFIDQGKAIKILRFEGSRMIVGEEENS